MTLDQIGSQSETIVKLQNKIYIGFRATAYRDGHIRAQERLARANIRGSILNLASQTDAATLVIDAIKDIQPIPSAKFGRIFCNANRGLLGLRLQAGELIEDHYALDNIIANRPFKHILRDFVLRNNLGRRSVEDLLQFHSIRSDTFVFDVKAGVSVQLYRGARPQRNAALSVSQIKQIAARMAAWFERNILPSGELPYKVCPSSNRHFTHQNNMIRQFMATVVLFRYAQLVGRSNLKDIARRNLSFNIAQFYKEFNGVGVIAFNNSSKLGACAMAALAIYEQEGYNGQHACELDMLLRGIDSLWQNDGSFRSFHYPQDRNDNQNFYPGEALCLWSRLLADNTCPDLLKRFFCSFAYYRSFHRRAPNPAFIPWHTQAYTRVYELTQNESLASFIFEMNDWLLSMQQTSTPYPDFVGRFYDPKRREFGPPHASSTAVYLEGLIDAYWLADKLGLQDRASRYSHAITLALLNLEVLQFDRTLSSVFETPIEKYLGAVRTNPYDCLVRIDNVQHALAALVNYLGRGLNCDKCPVRTDKPA